jgi:hypothetical protein
MTIKNGIVQVAIDRQVTDGELVDNLLEDASMLATAPFKASTHDIANVYEELIDVTGAQNINMDGELTQISRSTKLKTQDLTALGGIMTVGQDKATRMGGAVPYFNNQLPDILKATGQNVDHSLIYDITRKAAIDNGNVTSIGGSAANVQNSIVVVKWSRQNTGLFSEKMMGNGMVFGMEGLSGGQLHQVKNADGNDIPGYAMMIKTYLGFQMADTRGVSALVNIDATHKPTTLQIDELLTEARASGGDTALYMHPRVYNAYIKQLLSDNGVNNTTMNGANSVFDSFSNWNGIGIVQDWNFDFNLEAVVTL